MAGRDLSQVASVATNRCPEPRSRVPVSVKGNITIILVAFLAFATAVFLGMFVLLGQSSQQRHDFSVACVQSGQQWIDGECVR